MIYSVHSLPREIVIGKQTETGVTSIGFDCAAWIGKWPDMSFSGLVTPPASTEAYPAATRMEGSILYWDVNAADTATAGTGQMEIIGLAEGKKKISATVTTRIQPSATVTPGEVPEHAQPWVDTVLDAAARAEDAADRAEDAANGVTPEQLAGAVSAHNADTQAHPDIRKAVQDMIDNAGPNFEAGSGLQLKDGVLSVTTASKVEAGNNNPVSSKAVYELVGDINARLAAL